MSNWKQIDVPLICERIVGFSVPFEGRILVISYEGTHTIHLGSTITVKHDTRYIEYDIYDPDVGIADYGRRKYTIIGLHGGQPLLQSPQGESLILDTDSEIRQGRIERFNQVVRILLTRWLRFIATQQHRVSLRA